MLRPLRTPAGAVALALVLALAVVVPAAASGSRRDGSELRRAMAAFVKQPGSAPGIVVVVDRGRDGKVLTAGVANTGTGRRIDVDDHMRVASVAKAFTGGVAVALVRDRKLRLDDTVGGLRPDLPDEWAGITLAQLMQHTSGIPDFSEEESFTDALVASLLDPPPPVDLLGYIADPTPSFTPGTQYDYSNSDNVIVALMAESATGKPFARLLKSYVDRPLRLGDTSLPEGARLPRPFLHGYDVSDGEDVSELFAAGWTFASGGVVSTPAEMARFARAYASGRLTNRSTYARQLRFVEGSSEPPGPGTNSAGLSVFRYQTRCGTVYGHTGNTAGYTQFMAATRDGRRSATVSINGQITPKSDPTRFAELRAIYELAVCAALR
jgi:D-alanyl-D-alanine carboxypeptidase